MSEQLVIHTPKAPIPYQETRKVVTLYKEKGWGLRILGDGTIARYYGHQVWVEPVTPDSTMPREIAQRAQAIQAAGVRVKAWHIVHFPGEDYQARRAQLQRAVQVGLKTTGAVVRTVGVVAVTGLALLASALAGIDPALVCTVVEADGTEIRLQVGAWLED